MQYSQEHLKTMVYGKFGGQTECIMGNSKIENGPPQAQVPMIDRILRVCSVLVIVCPPIVPFD